MPQMRGLILPGGNLFCGKLCLIKGEAVRSEEHSFMILKRLGRLRSPVLEYIIRVQVSKGESEKSWIVLLDLVPRGKTGCNRSESVFIHQERSKLGV